MKSLWPIFCSFDLLVCCDHFVIKISSSIVFKVQCLVTLLCPIIHLYPISAMCCTNFSQIIGNFSHGVLRSTLLNLLTIAMFQHIFNGSGVNFNHSQTSIQFQCQNRLDLVHQILDSSVVILTIFIYFMYVASVHNFLLVLSDLSFSRSLTGSTHSFEVDLSTAFITAFSKSWAILFASLVVPTTKIISPGWIYFS